MLIKSSNRLCESITSLNRLLTTFTPIKLQMSELDADAQLAASRVTELDADDVEMPKVQPVVNKPSEEHKSANVKSSLHESIMSHNLERDRVSRVNLKRFQPNSIYVLIIFFSPWVG